MEEFKGMEDGADIGDLGDAPVDPDGFSELHYQDMIDPPDAYEGQGSCAIGGHCGCDPNVPLLDAKGEPELSLNDYQTGALITWKEDPRWGLMHLVLGLAGEAGEVAEKVKKYIRDDGADKPMTAARSQAIADELGDVIWYAAVLAHTIGYDFDQIAKRNLRKTMGRLMRGTIHGDGDNR